MTDKKLLYYKYKIIWIESWPHVYIFRVFS